MRDWSFTGFAGGSAASVCWLLFVRSGVFPGPYGVWLSISLPVAAMLVAWCATRLAPYGARHRGYWGAGKAICLLFPAIAAAIAPLPQFCFLTWGFLAMSLDTPWMVFAGPVALVVLWSEVYFIIFVVAAPFCAGGVAAFHGLLWLLAACRGHRGVAAKCV